MSKIEQTSEIGFPFNNKVFKLFNRFGLFNITRSIQQLLRFNSMRLKKQDVKCSVK